MQNLKRLTLKRMVIKNFRGIPYQDLEFDPMETTIVGPNKAGKSTVTEAWYWFFTGYDLSRQNNFEIKPRDKDGKTTDRIIVSVEIFLDNNGYDQSLRKEMHEKWAPIDDETEEEEFKENFFVFYDGARKLPTKKAFQEELDKIISPVDFSVMANADYFLRMKNEDMRKIILELVGGEISNEDLLAQKPEYAKLIEILNRKPVESYWKEIKASIKESQGQKKGLPDLIKQQVDNISKLPTEKEFSEIEANIVSNKLIISGIQDEISGKSTGEKFDAYNQSKANIESKKGDIRVFEVSFKNKVAIANSEVDSKKIPLQGQIKTNTAKIKSLQMDNSLLESRINSASTTLKEWLEDWHKIDKQEFVAPAMPAEGEDMPVCSLCQRPFSIEDLQSGEATLRESFNTEQIAKKKNIEGMGEAKHAEKVKWSDTLTKNIEEIQKLDKSNEDLEVRLAEIKVEDPKIGEDKDYILLTSDLKKMESDLGEEPKPDIEGLSEKEKTVSLEIDQLNQSLGQRKVRADLETELEKLIASEAKINKSILDFKRIDVGIKSYLKDRSEILEGKVNKMFDRIRFRLFEFTNDGMPNMVCHPTIDGVHYKTLNTAAKTEAQVDVMNTYIQKTGIIMPLFLDNQESVGSRPETLSQIINCEFHKHADFKELQILNK